MVRKKLYLAVLAATLSNAIFAEPISQKATPSDSSWNRFFIDLLGDIDWLRYTFNTRNPSNGYFMKTNGTIVTTSFGGKVFKLTKATSAGLLLHSLTAKSSTTSYLVNAIGPDIERFRQNSVSRGVTAFLKHRILTAMPTTVTLFANMMHAKSNMLFTPSVNSPQPEPGNTIGGSFETDSNFIGARLDGRFARNNWFILAHAQALYSYFNMGAYNMGLFDPVAGRTNFVRVDPLSVDQFRFDIGGRLAYRLNETMTPYVQAAFIAGANRKFNRNFAAPVINTAPQLLLALNGFRAGGGVAIRGEGFTVMPSYNYSELGQTFKSHNLNVAATFQLS